MSEKTTTPTTRAVVTASARPPILIRREDIDRLARAPELDRINDRILRRRPYLR